MVLLFNVTVPDNGRIIPSIVTGLVGQKVRFKCSGNNIKWYFESTQSDPVAYQNDLLLESLELSFAGTYYCYGIYPKTGKGFIAQAKVKIEGK